MDQDASEDPKDDDDACDDDDTYREDDGRPTPRRKRENEIFKRKRFFKE